jgi:hypothetical protein
MAFDIEIFETRSMVMDLLCLVTTVVVEHQSQRNCYARFVPRAADSQNLVGKRSKRSR